MLDNIVSELTNIINIVMSAIGALLVSTNFVWVMKNLRSFKKQIEINKQMVGDSIVKSLPKNIKLDVSTKIEDVVKPEMAKMEFKISKLIDTKLKMVENTNEGIKLLLLILKDFKVTKDNSELYISVINYLENNEINIDI